MTMKPKTSRMRNIIQRCETLGPVLLLLVLPATSAGQRSKPLTPVIYSTDLTYTFDMNEDDPFDAAVLLKCPELDVWGVILDNPKYSSEGDKILGKIMEYAGRRVKIVKGLGRFRMQSYDDNGLNAAHQEGVEFLISTLENSEQRVILIAVGSLTDFAVALVRTPALLKEKVAAVYVVAGSLMNPVQDHNVMLDPRAFVKVMRSGLPIVWVPVDTSVWHFPAPKMLVPEQNELAHFLLNELLFWQLNHWTHKDRYDYYDLGLTMWATPAFVLAVGDPEASSMVETAPAQVEFDDKGMIQTVLFGAEGSNMSVVRSVNGAKLNGFIVSRINR